MVKSIKRFSRLKPLTVLLKKKLNCLVLALPQLRQKVLQSSMTTRRKHGAHVIRTRLWRWAFSITEEAIEDNLYDSLSSRYTKALARAMAYTKQVKASDILNNAFAAGTTYGDGQSLCSTAHPLVSGGTNSNRPTVAADLNETSLEAAIIQIAGYTDERGLLIAAKPKKLVIPPALQFVATRLLETEGRVGTADNDINAIMSNGAVPGGYAVNHYLTDTDAWFMMTDVPNGLKHFVRSPMATSMDADFDTGNSRYKARERYSFGVSDPLGIYGSPGA